MKIQTRLGIIITLGIFLRANAFFLNDLPHGDVNIDLGTARMWHEIGQLVTPVIAARPYIPPDPAIWGYPQDQHAPFWPLLGGFITFITQDAYIALKLLTFIIGIALIPTVYKVTNKHIGYDAALLATVCTTVSYVLIDYSGNGSLYMLQAMLMLLFVHFVADLHNYFQALLLGFVMGIGYLTNYQMVILPFSLALFTLYIIFNKTFTVAQLKQIAFAFMSSLIIISPWLIRNQLLFGDPLYNVNNAFVLTKLGAQGSLSIVDSYLVTELSTELFTWSVILTRVFSWTARNSAYMILRLFILASMAWPIVLWRTAHLAARKSRLDLFEVPLIIVLALHIVLSCLWPVFKFRYFIPMLPLIFIWAGFTIYHTPKLIEKSPWLSLITVIGILSISVLTYWRVPSHTSYYDNNELISWRTSEAEWYAKATRYKEAINQLPSQADGSLLALEYSAYYYTDMPIVLLNSRTDDEIFQWLVERYNVQYIVLEKQQVSMLEYDWLVEELFTNQDYVVFQLIK